MTLVIWDWNGTLYDDVEVCRFIINTMLKRRSKKTLSLHEYKNVFCFPIPKYYKNAGLPMEEGFESLAHEWIKLYDQKQPECILNPLAEYSLKKLEDCGCRQIILSATKKEILAQEVQSFGIEGCFSALLGTGDRYANSKIDAGMEYLKNKDIYEKRFLIGDTLHDLEAAKALDCECLFVSSGHQNEEILKKSGCNIFENIAQAADYIAENIK